MATRIESCGRICYKSEDKINEESAAPFIENILKRKHNSVAEMAVISLKVKGCTDDDFHGMLETFPRYLAVDHLDGGLLISGSVRAFRELYMFHGAVRVVSAIASFWQERYPLFFADLPKASAPGGIVVERMPLAQVEELAADLLGRHRHVAVKFITNRAVTHEIVRHRPCAYLQESQRYCRYDKAQFGSEVTFIKPLFFAEDSAEYRLWERAMVECESIYLELLKSASPQAARTVLPNSCKTEIIVFAPLNQWAHIFKLRTPGSAEPSMRELMVPLQEEFRGRYPQIF